MVNVLLSLLVLLPLIAGVFGAYPTSRSATAVANPGLLGTFIQSVNEAKRHLVSAAVARSTSILGLYPMDTIKTRIQVDNPNPFKLAGLYGGVKGSLVGQVPYGVLVFGSYEMYKKALRKRFPKANPALVFASASVLGDVTGSVWLCPSEVIKQKMQAGIFSSEKEAFSSIWKARGLSGLYEGYFGGLARDVPFRVAQLTTYEVTKSLYLRLKSRRQKHSREKDEIQLTALESAACGAVAGSISAAMTSPLDRIKTLLMIDQAAYGGSVTACAAKIFREEGIGGFATGMLPRVAYIAPSVAVFFVAYETCQQKLKNWK